MIYLYVILKEGVEVVIVFVFIMIMICVCDFSFLKGLFGLGVRLFDVIGIVFFVGKMFGNFDNIKLWFDLIFMLFVVDGKF